LQILVLSSMPEDDWELGSSREDGEREARELVVLDLWTALGCMWCSRHCLLQVASCWPGAMVMGGLLSAWAVGLAGDGRSQATAA
jgi:hypothetical protein